jgi:hypothetical protein
VAVVCACAVSAAPAHAATIAVPANGDLQAAIDAAAPGDVITLAPGATYIGNFVLPEKAGNEFITLRSAAPDAELPPAGVRMTPAYSERLAKIKSPNSTSALRTAARAHHWKLLFLEFQANEYGYGDIIELGAGDSSQSDLSQVPHDLVLDRLYVHGDPLFGQKRGIALNSRDTTIVNSYVSDCKVIGQDSQAIAGFNGPGNYLIENNYLEAATENFILGGADPVIPNLVTTNVTFRHNYLRKPVEWRDPIIAGVSGVTATAVPGGGSLPAGVYTYTVVARRTASQTDKANAVPSLEATVSTGAAGGVTVAWSPVPDAEDYVVFGRTAGHETMYWTTAQPYFTDTGAAGKGGTPSKQGTRWSIKNLFELKNAQDVVVEGNVFENLWVGGQSGFPIVFTPRNQDGHAPWAVVQRVTFRNNLVRHTAGGVNILGTDDIHPSQRLNHIVVADNIFEDISKSWGAGSRFVMMGNGADSVTIDHNTVLTDQTTIVSLYGGSVSSPIPNTNVVFTNNMSAHNSYGIIGTSYGIGTSSIDAYMTGAVVSSNVLAGGRASQYPAGNFFPSVAAWQSSFADYAGGDYHLTPSSPYRNAGTDGRDLGADVDAVEAQTASALSGDNSVPPGVSRVQITTASLPDAVYGQPYSAQLACTGGTSSCAWQVTGGALPSGLSFDGATGTVSGVPASVEQSAMTVTAYDPAWPTNTATRTIPVSSVAPAFTAIATSAPGGAVGSAYTFALGAAGALGTVTWSVVSGALPPGLVLDALDGRIIGTPAGWGTYTAVVQAQDSWGTNRIATTPVTVVVSPAPLSIADATLAPGAYETPYATSLTAIGGTGSTTWTIVDGALPSGVSLQADGTLAGTPGSIGTFTFTVQAADAAWPGDLCARTLTLTIDAREVVLYAGAADVVRGTWTRVIDSDAAGGARLWNPDAKAPKLGAALAAPVNYFELTFNAQAGVGYHLWMRGRADGDSWANDSVYVQFSQSVDADGAPVYRIGTTSAATVSIENGTNAGLSGWGWNDNSYSGLADPIYFAASGPQTIRVQVREDGLSIDQIVLSADRYTTDAPGAAKDDATIVAASSGSGGSGDPEQPVDEQPAPPSAPPPAASSREVVLYATDAPVVTGAWSRQADASAAGGFRLWNPNAGAAKITKAAAAPASYFELTFNADAGVPYHLWVRGRADGDSWANDSAYVQFSQSVDGNGAPLYRIGTTSGAAVSVEDGTNAGVSGWGWNDNAYSGLADPIYFAASGPQTIRVQVREDGLSIDQIVLSADTYATTAPGATKNDTTILARQ